MCESLGSAGIGSGGEGHSHTYSLTCLVYVEFVFATV